jgi:hypothetical protein
MFCHRNSCDYFRSSLVRNTLFRIFFLEQPQFVITLRISYHKLHPYKTNYVCAFIQQTACIFKLSSVSELLAENQVIP